MPAQNTLMYDIILFAGLSKKGAMQLVYCPTEDMVADTLTKALPSVKVKHFAVELGLSMV